MTFGIQIQSSSGFTQIDDTMVNYVLRASGSLAVSGSFNNPSSDTVDVSAFVTDATKCLFFVRPTVVNSAISGQVRADGVAKIEAWQTGTVQWRVYERADAIAVPASGYGINVMKPNGSLAYSSEYAVPLIFAVVSGFPSFSVGSVTHSYAAIPFGLLHNCYVWSIFYEDDPVPDELNTMALQWYSATSVGVGTETEEYYSSGSNEVINTSVRSWCFIEGS